jgi:hypothetical protein
MALQSLQKLWCVFFSNWKVKISRTLMRSSSSHTYKKDNSGYTREGQDFQKCYCRENHFHQKNVCKPRKPFFYGTCIRLLENSFVSCYRTRPFLSEIMKISLIFNVIFFIILESFVKHVSVYIHVTWMTCVNENWMSAPIWMIAGDAPTFT